MNDSPCFEEGNKGTALATIHRKWTLRLCNQILKECLIVEDGERIWLFPENHFDEEKVLHEFGLYIRKVEDNLNYNE